MWLIRLISVLLCSTEAIAILREYNIAIVDLEWDYAPSGKDLIKAQDDVSKQYLETTTSPPRIGRKYMKAAYRECTDSSCNELKPHPSWLGLTGPIIHAELNDTVHVNFVNKASYNFSIHPHGVFYRKGGEGARYIDGTSGANKSDDRVPPNGRYLYQWEIQPHYAPTPDDPDCITWLYHSHFMAEEEIQTGAVGIIITCKKGILDANNKRLDKIDKEYALVFTSYDENFSHYLKQNIQKYLPTVTEQDILANYKEFQATNIKYAINGYAFGNLPDFNACVGDQVSLHIAVVGNDYDLHSVYIQGQSMVLYKQRVSTIAVTPGITYTASITAKGPGNWYMSSQSFDHLRAGMEGIFSVKQCDGKKNPLKTQYGTVRRYYIAAEEIEWDYAPSGVNTFTGNDLATEDISNMFFGDATADGRNLCRLKGVYKKAVFRRYYDWSFRRVMPHDKSLGILGPVIRAEVGDTVKVTFYNKASRPYSIQPFLFGIDKYNEGMSYNDSFHGNQGFTLDGRPTGAQVLPGKIFEYTWTVTENEGPTILDPDCLFSRYFSGVDQIRDTYTGLTGPLLICKPGTLKLNGRKIFRQMRDFYLMFSVVNENLNHYLNDSLRRIGCTLESANEDPTFGASNMMGSINGYSYGNLPGLEMCVGDQVNWYLMGVGTTNITDLHVPFFHGNTFSIHGHSTDSYFLLADTFLSVQMKPDNIGTWSITDRVVNPAVNFFVYGLKAKYFVSKCNNRYTDIDSSLYQQGKIRTYYIGAVEECHNYTLSNLHPVLDVPLADNEVSRIYTLNTDEQIGSIYKKIVYREFTDSTFNTQKTRGPKEAHLRILGPMIKAEVGDTIRVVFKNLAFTSNRSFSIQPGLVLYDKNNEGSQYLDGWQQPKKGSAVAPGNSFTYTWFVPKRSGPGRDDFNCINTAYSSAVDATRDTYSGLVGPLIICRKGTLTDSGDRKDVAHEFALLFFIFNENLSWMYDYNLKAFIPKDRQENIVTDNPDFRESNVKLSINGGLFAGVCGVNINQYNTAAFYVMSMGAVADTHTAHWHGNTFIRLQNGRHRHDVIDVYPGEFETVELIGVNPGTWLLHCHVNNHSETGMEMVYHVISPVDKTTQPSPCEEPHPICPALSK